MWLQVDDMGEGRPANFAVGKSDPESRLTATPSGRWRQLARPIIFRAPWPAALSVIFLAAVVGMEQVAEELLLMGDITPRRLLFRMTLVALVLYELFAVLLLKHQIVQNIPRLRAAVDVERSRFGHHARAMVRASQRWEVGLLVASAIVVLVLFWGLDSEFPLGGSLDSVGSPIVVTGFLLVYVLIGWFGLTLIQTSLQHAVGLRRLAQLPLSINVYDPDSVLPFGWLALVHSLVFLGLIVLLLIPLGIPTGASGLMVVTLASGASVLTLLLPIWPVFLQTRNAKEHAINGISGELMKIEAKLVSPAQEPDENVADLNARTNALVNLRKTIHEVPTWPFRSTTTIVRALTAALSPLIYFVLIELTRAYLVPVIIR